MSTIRFKPLTFEEALAKKKQADERAKKRRELKKLRKQSGKQPLKTDRIRTLKKKLWDIFSKYVRRSWADRHGMVETVDGKIAHWKQVDCGHLLSNGERNAQLGGNELWYYLKNFAPQSSKGNRFNADDSAKEYMFWAVTTYGQAEISKMFRMKHTPKVWTEQELIELYEYYKAEFAKINI